jgi:hypothetical protein
LGTQPPHGSEEERLNAFFDEPQNLSRLPLDPVGRISDARIEPDQDGLPVVGFNVPDRKGHGRLHHCKCNPAGYAFLRVAVHLGASAFIDHNSADRPYLKMLGQMEQSAGIIFGRIIAGCEEGEDTKYLNDNSLDFRQANLDCRRNPRARRGREDFYAENS